MYTLFHIKSMIAKKKKKKKKKKTQTSWKKSLLRKHYIHNIYVYSEFLQLIHNYYTENLCHYLGNIPNVTDPFPSRSKSWKTILCWAPGLHSKASNAKNSLNEIKLQEKQRVSWILICLRNFSHFPFLNPLTPWSNLSFSLLWTIQFF